METKHREETDKQAIDDLNDEGIEEDGETGKNNGGDIRETVNTGEFQDFTPRDDIKIDGKLKEAFDNALDPKKTKITNIGLLGRFSSGKSSLVNSYLKQREEIYGEKINYVKISFAHFKSNENGTDDKKNIDNITNSNVLEKKIVNQLINLIDYRKINQTSFYVKRKIKDPEVILFITYICTLIIFKFCKWIYENDFLLYAILLTFSVTITILYIRKLYLLVRIGYKFKFSKLELDVNKNDENVKSYFDVYLTEIIYVIENSGLNLIIFEDIDRFEITSIFERLYEVNGIINRKLKKYSNKNKCVKFLYVLREDIFNSDEDKHKFFDFIISAPNIVNKSNSYNIFHQLFESSNHKIDYDFLKEVSNYFTDVRVIKGVYNEFLIYYDILLKEIHNGDKENLDVNRIFAIVVYKNILPKDFDLLQENEGILHYLLFEANIVNTKVIKEVLETENPIEIKDKKEIEELNIINYIKFLIVSDDTCLLSNINRSIANKIEYYKFRIYIKRLNMIGYVFRDTNIVKDLKSYYDNYILNVAFGILFKILSEYDQNGDVLKSSYIKICRDILNNFNDLYKSNSYKRLDILLEYILIDHKSNKREVVENCVSCLIEQLLIEDLKKDENKYGYYKLTRTNYKKLFVKLVSKGYLDKEILDYTRFFNEETSDTYKTKITKEYARKIKMSALSLELYDISIYLKNFYQKFDYGILLNEVDLEYWSDNLNILNFGLLDSLLNYKGTNYEINNDRIKIFISNLYHSLKFGKDRYCVFKNVVRIMFCCEYYLFQKDEDVRKNFMKVLQEFGIKFYNLDYCEKYTKDEKNQEIQKFLEEIIVNDMYYVSAYNLKFLYNYKKDSTLIVDNSGRYTYRTNKNLIIRKYIESSLNNMISLFKTTFICEINNGDLGFYENIEGIPNKYYYKSICKFYNKTSMYNVIDFLISFFKELILFLNKSYKLDKLYQYKLFRIINYNYRHKDSNGNNGAVEIGLKEYFEFLKDDKLIIDSWGDDFSLLQLVIFSLFRFCVDDKSKNDQVKSVKILSIFDIFDDNEDKTAFNLLKFTSCLNNILCISFVSEVFGKYIKSGFYNKEDVAIIKERSTKYYKFMDVDYLCRYLSFKLFTKFRYGELNIFQLFLEARNSLDLKINMDIYLRIKLKEEHRERLPKSYALDINNCMYEISQEKYVNLIIDFINNGSNTDDFYNLINKYGCVYLANIIVNVIKETNKSLDIPPNYDENLFVFRFCRDENYKYINNKGEVYYNDRIERLDELNIDKNIFIMNYLMDFSNIKEYLFIDPEEFSEYNFDEIRYIVNFKEVCVNLFDIERNRIGKVEKIEIDLFQGDNFVTTLNFEDYIPVYYKDKIIPFLEFIITSNDINDDKYEEILSSIGFRDDSKTYEIKLDKNTKINDVIRKIANDKYKVGSLNEDKLKILTKLGFREE